MFEFSIAFKYLIPRKKHLSVTLIAMMSVGVISLIVWLLLVFLSVTNGIESSWLKKLTDLNAPVRVTPTPAYYSSYYYKVDSISSASGFALKTLGEKKEAFVSDPYDPEEDPEVPPQWQKPALDASRSLIDPVKGLVSCLAELQKKHQDLFYQDYEMSGALLKLQLLRNQSPSLFTAGQESMNFLTQVSYLATPPVQKKTLASLLIPFSAKDINHLLFLANYRMERTLEDGAPLLRPASEAFQGRIHQILSFLKIHTLKTVSPYWKFPGALLPENVPFSISGPFSGENLKLEDSFQKKSKTLLLGTVVRKGNELYVSLDGRSFTLETEATYFEVAKTLIFKATMSESSINTARHMQEIGVFVEGSLQGRPIKGELPWKDLLVDTFTLLSESETEKNPRHLAT